MINISNIDDLPDSLKRQLIMKKNEDDEKIIKLFEEHKSLTIDEVIVGLWRRHQMHKDRKWYTTRLNILKKKGFLEKVEKSKSVFTLKTNNEVHHSE